MWSQLFARMTWCSTAQSLNCSFPNAGLLLCTSADSHAGPDPKWWEVTGNLGALF